MAEIENTAGKSEKGKRSKTSRRVGQGLERGVNK